MSTKYACLYRTACMTAVAMLCVGGAQAASDVGTTTIKSDSDNAKTLKLNEQSYQTREERLNAKPLDWRKTSGKPVKLPPAKAAQGSARKAKPGSAEGGAPDPRADEEARKLHPEDWTKPSTSR